MVSSHQKSPPPGVHPVVALALQYLVKPSENAPFRIDRDDLSRVRDALARLQGDDLKTAVKGLIELAFFLDSAKRSPDAAAALLMVAESAAERRSLKLDRDQTVTDVRDVQNDKRAPKKSAAGAAKRRK